MRTPNRNRNRYTIRAERVSTPTEEWTEFRVYNGKGKNAARVACFLSEAKAEAWVWALTH